MGFAAVTQKAEQRVGAEVGFNRAGSFKRRGDAEETIRPLKLPGGLERDVVLPPEQIGNEMRDFLFFPALWKAALALISITSRPSCLGGAARIPDSAD